MDITAKFLEFLSTWVAEKVLDQGVDHAMEMLSDLLPKLESSLRASGWNTPVTDQQKRLVKLIARPIVRPTDRIVSFVRKRSAQPILIVGPSGSGKSLVATRLVGKEPSGFTTMSTSMERKALIDHARRARVLIAPGDWLHGADGLEAANHCLRGPKPPKVVCIVTAGGYLATSTPSFHGSFMRPSSEGEDVADDVAGFAQY